MRSCLLALTRTDGARSRAAVKPNRKARHDQIKRRAYDEFGPSQPVAVRGALFLAMAFQPAEPQAAAYST
jgi:hypothetical protein